MINSKYPTTLEFDLKLLDMLNHTEGEELPLDEDDEDLPEIRELIESKKDHLWRYKLAVVHRVNQKEILHDQLKHVRILHQILGNCKKLIEVAEEIQETSDRPDGP